MELHASRVRSARLATGLVMLLTAIVILMFGPRPTPAEAACGEPGGACIYILGSSPSVPNTSLNLQGSAGDVSYPQYTECNEGIWYLLDTFYGLNTTANWAVRNSGGTARLRHAVLHRRALARTYLMLDG